MIFFSDANKIMKILCLQMQKIFGRERKLYTDKENQIQIAPTTFKILICYKSDNIKFLVIYMTMLLRQLISRLIIQNYRILISQSDYGMISFQLYNKVKQWKTSHNYLQLKFCKYFLLKNCRGKKSKITCKITIKQ